MYVHQKWSEELFLQVIEGSTAARVLGKLLLIILVIGSSFELLQTHQNLNVTDLWISRVLDSAPEFSNCCGLRASTMLALLFSIGFVITYIQQVALACSLSLIRLFVEEKKVREQQKVCLNI